MPVLQFEVTGQSIKRMDSCKPVAKCQNYFTAHFTFLSDEWQGVKTALFTMNGASTAMVLDDDGNCTVPWEFFDVDYTTIGAVSVFCGDLVTANAAPVTVYRSGYTESSASEPPTPDVYAQITDNIVALTCGIQSSVLADSNEYIEKLTERIAALEQNALGG